MKPPFRSKDEAQAGVGQMLNQLLAEESMLYATTRDYHWNVTGRDFSNLHRQFEEQYEQTAEAIDQIAERARAVGAGARGSWAELTEAARSTAEAGIGLAPDKMLSELLDLHEALIAQLRTGGEACVTRFHDPGTADFLVGLMTQHEKTAWMLRAQLETHDAENTRRAPSVAMKLKP